MGIYREQLLPRLVDRACGSKGYDRWRREVTAGLSGTVVEIGFGSGLNMPAYPAAVERVYAVEPASLGRRLAAGRIADSHVHVEHVGAEHAGCFARIEAVHDQVRRIEVHPDRAGRQRPKELQ